MYELLETSLAKSGLLDDVETDLSLLRLTMAARLPDDELEIFESVYDLRERDGEFGPAKDNCETFVDVRGQRACSVEEFWTLVGPDQAHSQGPLQVKAGG